jgi:hypothetical protein
MKRLAATALACVVSGAVFAKTPPPAEPFESRTWPASMTKEPSAGITFGELRVRFEETTLDEVKRAASSGQISHAGDAGESHYWLCYTLTQRQQPARIWLMSSEMGGEDHAVTNATVTRLRSATPTVDCPTLSEKLVPVSLDLPIWVGSREAAVQRALGKPSYRQGAWRSYDFEGKVPGRCGGGYDLANWLLFESRGGLVESIHVGRVTSC